MLAFLYDRRHLEHADQITRLIDAKFDALIPTAVADAVIDAGEWNELLRALRDPRLST